MEDLIHLHSRMHELSDDQRMELQMREQAHMRRRIMPNNPRDPFFYHVYSSTLPKEHHYRIVPEGKSSFQIHAYFFTYFISN